MLELITWWGRANGRVFPHSAQVPRRLATVSDDRCPRSPLLDRIDDRGDGRILRMAENTEPLSGSSSRVVWSARRWKWA
jgi:hypothetical protein